MSDIVPHKQKTTRIEYISPIDAAQVGDWYWVTEPDEERALYCIEHKGSNFFRFSRSNRRGSSYTDVHFDNFEAWCEPEDLWEELLQTRIDNIQRQIREKTNLLIDEGKKLCLIGANTEVVDPENLLPAVTSREPKAYQKELVEFRDDKMPAIKEEIAELAMDYAKETKNLSLPDLFKLESVKKALGVVEDRIFTVELYCGLQENVHQIADGNPAEIDEPIGLRQLLLYMDEECLFDYDTGGMDFEKLSDFDKWVVRPENLSRILPEQRGVVALKVRRSKKDYGHSFTLVDAFIKMHKDIANMKTYLLIRNGEQVYRIASQIEFSPRLVPLRNEIGEKQFHEERHWWGREGKPEDWEPKIIGPENVKFDNHAQKQDDLIKHYNRIFIFIQGLLDRSTVFHPHPPIKLNSGSDVSTWINLIRDEEDVLPSYNAPVWEVYRDQLNKSLKVGDLVWSVWHSPDMGSYRGYGGVSRDSLQYTVREQEIMQRPKVCEIKSIRRDRSEVCIKWEAEYWTRGRWNYQGHWVDGGYHLRNRNLWVPMEKCFNLNAYMAGDYKMFLCDRHSKGAYLKWANPLLSSEEYARDPKSVNSDRSSSNIY